LGPRDYESPALTAELQARRALTREHPTANVQRPIFTGTNDAFLPMTQAIRILIPTLSVRDYHSLKSPCAGAFRSRCQRHRKGESQNRPGSDLDNREILRKLKL